MANKKTGTVIVRGSSGNVGRIVLPGAISVAHVEDFLTSISSVAMEGSAVSVAYSESKKTGTAITGGNTDRKGIIVYADATDNSINRISIPSWGNDPGDSTMEASGERIPLVMCQSIVEALETATGRTLTAIEGWVIQKK
jgi:hypothetical protein